MSDPQVWDKNWADVVYDPPEAWDVMPGPNGGTARICNTDGAKASITKANGEIQHHVNCKVGSSIEFMPNVAIVTMYPN